MEWVLKILVVGTWRCWDGEGRGLTLNEGMHVNVVYLWIWGTREYVARVNMGYMWIWGTSKYGIHGNMWHVRLCGTCEYGVLVNMRYLWLWGICIYGGPCKYGIHLNLSARKYRATHWQIPSKITNYGYTLTDLTQVNELWQYGREYTDRCYWPNTSNSICSRLLRRHRRMRSACTELLEITSYGIKFHLIVVLFLIFFFFLTKCLFECTQLLRYTEILGCPCNI